MKTKISKFKMTINPFTLIFWSAVIVIIAFFGLLFGRKKEDLRKT
jgi:hypothetical protein